MVAILIGVEDMMLSIFCEKLVWWSLAMEVVSFYDGKAMKGNKEGLGSFEVVSWQFRGILDSFAAFTQRCPGDDDGKDTRWVLLKSEIRL
ncbi:hypothetical protein L2E82_19469 [Cichorium intybus]|uniref:Uncharacterized protein n=1 Tax=Cichorium intybus TaxID=13427 RepID=A0ACB9FBE2_CICIN|nr:hypothetical protein L2E82_19469 [Cichorium intybus]